MTLTGWWSSPPQVKRLKDLETEKDALCCGLDILERTRFWYLQRLEENRARQDIAEAEAEAESKVGCSQGAASEVQLDQLSQPWHFETHMVISELLSEAAATENLHGG